MAALPSPGAIAAPFRYEILDAGLASTARELAADLRSFHRRTTEEAFHFGVRLVALRNRTDDRTFVRWIETHVCVGKSTAYRFMSLAESFRPDDVSHVGKLGPTAAYALASKATPDAFRQDVVRRLAAGEAIASDNVTALIREAQQEAGLERRRTSAKAERAKRNDPAVQSRAAKRRATEERKHEAARQAATKALRSAAEMIVDMFNDEQLNALVGLLEAGRDWAVRGEIAAVRDERGRR